MTILWWFNFWATLYTVENTTLVVPRVEVFPDTT